MIQPILRQQLPSVPLASGVPLCLEPVNFFTIMADLAPFPPKMAVESDRATDSESHDRDQTPADPVTLCADLPLLALVDAAAASTDGFGCLAGYVPSPPNCGGDAPNATPVDHGAKGDFPTTGPDSADVSDRPAVISIAAMAFADLSARSDIPPPAGRTDGPVGLVRQASGDTGSFQRRQSVLKTDELSRLSAITEPFLTPKIDQSLATSATVDAEKATTVPIDMPNTVIGAAGNKDMAVEPALPADTLLQPATKSSELRTKAPAVGINDVGWKALDVPPKDQPLPQKNVSVIAETADNMSQKSDLNRDLPRLPPIASAALENRLPGLPLPPDLGMMAQYPAPPHASVDGVSRWDHLAEVRPLTEGPQRAINTTAIFDFGAEQPENVTNTAESRANPHAPSADLSPVAFATAGFSPVRSRDAAVISPAQIATAIPALAVDLLRLVQTAPDGPVMLTLRPDDLGTLRFEMTQTDQGLHIHLAVDQPETLDLLRRQGEQLLADLRQSGFAGATLSFSGGGTQDAPPQKGDPSPDMSRTAANAQSRDHHLPPPRPIVASGTLDLRL